MPWSKELLLLFEVGSDRLADLQPAQHGFVHVALRVAGLQRHAICEVTVLSLALMSETT